MLRKADDYKISWPDGVDPDSGRTSHRPGKGSLSAPLSISGSALADKLRGWARAIAARTGMPVYQVLTKAAIEGIAASMPSNLSELQEVKGMGPVKIRKYGGEILDIVDGAR